MEEILFSLKHYWRFVDSEALEPGLLRCRCFGLLLPKQLGSGDMRSLGDSLAFRPGFLWPSRTFAIGREVDLLGERPQGGHQFSRTHAPEDMPCLLWDGQHHAVIRLGDVMGDI